MWRNWQNIALDKFASEDASPSEAACYAAKRLQKERYKSFWQSGVFRRGCPDQRRAWIMQRLNENFCLKCFNPYMEAA